MDEEKYTRDSAKKSTRNKGKDEKSRTAEKKHGSKLKNEASANKSYRDKLRYGKKDNHISAGEEKQLRRMKKHGRRKIYRQTAAADTMRTVTVTNAIGYAEGYEPDTIAEKFWELFTKRDDVEIVY